MRITIQNHLSNMENGAGKTALMTFWPNLKIILYQDANVVQYHLKN